MKIGQVCNHEVRVIRREASVLDAARLMREAHVGDLVVVEEKGSHRVPIGMITDRDIVVGVVAKEVPDLDKLAVGDVLIGELVIARSDEDFSDALARMRRHGIRRIPVVDKHGDLEGIFTLDDLLAVLTHDLESVVRLLARQGEHERQTRA